MPIKITDLITTTDPSDTYATHDSTMGKGGLHEVADIIARDAITVARRKVGMIAFVVDTGLYYTLGSDLLTWSTFSAGGVLGTSIYEPILANGLGNPDVVYQTGEQLVPNFLTTVDGDIIMGIGA